MSLVFYTHRQIDPCLGEFTVHAASMLKDCRQEVSLKKNKDQKWNWSCKENFPKFVYIWQPVNGELEEIRCCWQAGLTDAAADR